MVWMIEDLIGTKNGSNVNFTISHTANASSMMVIHNGIRQLQVAVNPQSGEAEYGVTATAIKMGIAPAAGTDVWCRYWW